MLDKPPLAGRRSVREKAPSVEVCARVAEQRNARELLKFDEKRSNFVRRVARNCLQPRRAVKMDHRGDPVAPIRPGLVIEQHVRIWRPRAEDLRRPIFQTDRRHGPEVLATLDVVEMILHCRARRRCKNASTPRARGPSSAHPERKMTGLLSAESTQVHADCRVPPPSPAEPRSPARPDHCKLTIPTARSHPALP